MIDIKAHLLDLSDSLDQNGLIDCANAVDDLLIKTDSLTKIAQYVGVIGYVLKQNRAMSNCIRRKHADSQKTPMQEIVLDCLKEYQDGQQYSDTEWTSKYAQAVEIEPSSFDMAHLEYLNTIYDDNDLQKDFNNLDKVSNILFDHNVEDETINIVISNFCELRNMLQKDAGQSDFFFEGAKRITKEAQAGPKSKRGFLSKLFAPSFTRRGRLDDATKEVLLIQQHLGSIMTQTSSFARDVNRFKRTSLQYNDRSHSKSVEKLVGWVKKINLNDAFRSQKMLHLIANANPDANAQDINVFNSMKRNASALLKKSFALRRDIDNRYNQIDNILETLGQRDALFSQEEGSNTRLYDVYGDLESTIRDLDEDRFNFNLQREARNLAGKMRSQLMALSGNERYNDNISTPVNKYEMPAPEEMVEPKPITPAQPGLSDRTTNIDNADEPNMDNAADEIYNEISNSEDIQQFMNNPAFRRAIAQIIVAVANGDYKNPNVVLRKLESKMRNTSSPVKATEEALELAPTPTPTPTPAPAPAPAPAPTEVTAPAPAPAPVPATEKEEPSLFDSVQIDEQASEEEGMPMFTPVFNTQKRRRSKQQPLNANASFISIPTNILIKIADELDKRSPEFADIIDEYLDEASNKQKELPNFPNYTKIIKEHKQVL